MMHDVMRYLEALASGIGYQDDETLYSFYAAASNQLETEAEREAFRLGALALTADVAGMRLRNWYYTRKFKKAMKNLKGAMN